MRSSIAKLLRVFPAFLVALLCVAGVVTAPAGALERDATYGDGPRTPFYFPGEDTDTSDVAGLQPTAVGGGLDVIGDSVSSEVPYVQRAAADGVRAHVRAWGGWTVRLHRTVTGWPSTTMNSIDAAAASDSAAVFVELGTNDVGCLVTYGLCPETPAVDSEEYPTFLETERQAVRDEVQAAAQTLLDAEKCIVWAGPRRGSTGYAADA